MKLRNQRRSESAAETPGVPQTTSDGPISGSRKKGELTTGGRWLLGLFFSVFLAVGLGVTYALALKPWMDVRAARDWTQVPCTILSSDVREHSDSDSTTYSVEVVYSYRVGGRAYKGDRYDFTSGSSSGRSKKQAIVQRYRAGSKTICYVNPEDPRQSVLVRDGVRDWGFGLIPLVFAVVGGAGVCFAIFGQRQKSSSRWGRNDGGNFRDGSAFRSARARTHTVDEAARMSGSPVELKPAASRLGGLIVLVLFALFWNGVVSAFAVSIVRDALRGSWGMWLFVLFLVPFVAVGVFLIGLIVRQVMVLRNPVPKILVSRGAAAPGETIEISWRFEGGAGRLSALRIFLEGREEATYRRGTDTRTDREVFATLEIASVQGLGAGEPGHAKLRLPDRLMHSFKAKHNAVVWSLGVAGDIARWPDVDEKFEFTVLPVSKPTALSAAEIS